MTDQISARQGLAQTLKANRVALITGVHGDPCTALLDHCHEVGLRVEISVEEKTAFAQALGSSVAGLRAAVIVKQVGMNVLSDPLVGAVHHGTGAGLLLIAGDDPGAEKSTHEEDSRWYAKLADIPVLTPRDAVTISQATVEALELSEKLGIPAMMQITSRLLEAVGPQKIPVASTAGRFNRDRAWKNLILDRSKHYYRELYPKLMAHVELSALNALGVASSSTDGVISMGFVSTLVRHENHLTLGYAHPLPTALVDRFVSRLKRVLVVEETAPIVEQAVMALVGQRHASVQVLGRLSGHLPRIGKLEAEQIQRALDRTPEAWDLDVKAAVNPGILQLPCGGFEKLYEVLDDLLPEDYPVAGDVGCSILHGYFPPLVVDTAYALGTSISTGAGMGINGRKGIAIIGDTGFLHSGITALLNAVEHRHNLLVIVLHNRLSAMTPGQQQVKGFGRIRALIEACGADRIDEIQMTGITADDLKRLLSQRMSEQGVNVVIAEAEPRRLSDAR